MLFRDGELLQDAAERARELRLLAAFFPPTAEHLARSRFIVE